MRACAVLLLRIAVHKVGGPLVLRPTKSPATLKAEQDAKVVAQAENEATEVRTQLPEAALVAFAF